MKRAYFLAACLLLGALLSSCRGFRAANDMAGLLQNPEFGRTGANTWSFDFPEEDYDTTGSSRAIRRGTMIALLHGWNSFALEKSALTATTAADPIPVSDLSPVRYDSIGRPNPFGGNSQPETLDGEVTDWTRYVAKFSNAIPSTAYPNDPMVLGQQFAAEGTREARHWQLLLDRTARNAAR